MKGREIKEAVRNKFLCEVLIAQHYKAKKKALEIIKYEAHKPLWSYVGLCSGDP